MSASLRSLPASVALTVAAALFACSISSACAGQHGAFVQSGDGVSIHYTDRGAGDVSLVFVHGWNCDSGYWRTQRDVFAKTHRVITLDLAGHGASGQDRSNWTMAAFGQDVAAVVAELGLDRVVLVGHSMGGKVVVEAASQLGDRVVAVVGVDTFHNGGRPTPTERQRTILAGLEADYRGSVSGLVDRMFIEQSDPTLRASVAADMLAAPFASAYGARSASGRYDATAGIAALDVPLILISSDYLPTDLDYLRRHARTLRYREMSGVGHFVMLEDPDAFNAHLTAALAELTLSTTPNTGKQP